MGRLDEAAEGVGVHAGCRAVVTCYFHGEKGEHLHQEVGVLVGAECFAETLISFVLVFQGSCVHVRVGSDCRGDR